MDKEIIAQRIIELSGEDRRISCENARRLAEEAGVDYAEIGRLCDELGVKIRACQLGCF